MASAPASRAAEEQGLQRTSLRSHLPRIGQSCRGLDGRAGGLTTTTTTMTLTRGRCCHLMRRRTLLGLFRVFTPDAGSASESPSKVNCR
jgi:hypothetical protein